MKIFLTIPILLSLNAYGFDNFEHKKECIGKYSSYSQEDIDGYNFGLKIQKAFKNKDLELLLDLIKLELDTGPRINRINQVKFNDLFSEEYTNDVLSEKPSCKRNSWRGWMLADGRIWYKQFYYDYSNDDSTFFSIHALNSANNIERQDFILGGWYYQDKLIHPETFTKMSISGDFFEEIVDQKNITNAEDFYSNPGKYVGKDIGLDEFIKTSWADKKIPFSVPTDYIVNKNPNNGENNSKNQPCAKLYEDSRGETCYSLLAEIPLELCNNLAPNINLECKQSYLIYLGDWGGGSLGFQYESAIYGIFEKNNKAYVTPLKYIGNLNNGLNYLDAIEK
jgi:hypothetical protein